jgi:F0F1-type ATP synthase assembly protein I
MPADPSPNGPRAPMGFLVAGSEMASFTIAGLLLDYICGTLPWITIGMTLLGFMAAFFQLITMAKRIAAKKPEASRESQEQN